jgi:ATP-dependent helicase/nuclease subunit A
MSPSSPPDLNPQLVAADPKVSAFVSANAGSGKTKTLVDRVARLLLHGARPEAILCVTYTKAAAAEMQRRLFNQLGGWSMMPDDTLTAELNKIGEAAADLSAARRLFAQALETPGGLKIETLHAFCEKLLRRFPLEAGVSPGFTVLDDAAAAQISAEARDEVARLAALGAPALLADAYARFASTLDFQSFEAMFATFEGKREAILAYVERCGGLGGLPIALARACGLASLVSADTLRAQAMTPPVLDPALWREGAAALCEGGVRDQTCARKMAEVAEADQADLDAALSVFCTAKGEPAKWLETAKAIKTRPALQARLIAERERLLAAAAQARAAQVAEDSVYALTLAYVYARAFAGGKAAQGALDFTDLVQRACDLLIRADAGAWVLYKMDGGIDHVLLDEAQDTAPPQWDILRALTAEFFSGAGVRSLSKPRTLFIVGDEKQSIYSFQGAAPEQLSQEAAGYAQAAEGAGLAFKEAPLLASWRSTPQVLRFVDAVFEPAHLRAALQPRRPGMEAPATLIRHIANRRDQGGTIDLWPLEQEETGEDRRAWDEPLDVEVRRGAYRRLAEKIAAEIKALVARGERVHDKGVDRPANYGDVLILVRKRKALFQELLRAMKHAGVPVAGADRLALSEHPVFEDLLAFAQVALFPNDDLTLAAVLRSPLCDIDEDGLYDLAQGREGSLWAALQRRADERLAWGAARDLIAWAMDEMRRRTPFDLFSRLTTRLDAEGRSIRQRFTTRLGPEAGDALDEVLAQALGAEARGIHDLERFADAVSRLNLTIKREMDEPRGEVRVMTAHSAKGLEAPIVFLPETVSGGTVRGSPLLETEEGGFLWCAAKAADCEASAAARAARGEKEDGESLRLLYVALTRSRDRLVIAGRINARAKPDALKGWWAPMCAALDHPSLAGGGMADQVRTVQVGEMSVRRFGADPKSMRASHLSLVTDGPPPPPAWALRPPPPDAPWAAYATPSTAAESARGSAPSPLARAGRLGRFRRGELIHRLLQLLPDLAPDARDDAAVRLLAKEPDLDRDQRTEIATAALTLLADARFAEVFGPGSRAEAAIAGGSIDLPPGLRLSGRVDRMVVTASRVLVVDFKTNRPSPDRIEDADPAYLRQMALYVAVLRTIFPGRRVEAALVWTDGPKLMPIEENIIATVLADLRHTA